VQQANDFMDAWMNISTEAEHQGIDLPNSNTLVAIIDVDSGKTYTPKSFKLETHDEGTITHTLWLEVTEN
jgi:hypothetical protein